MKISLLIICVLCSLAVCAQRDSTGTKSLEEKVNEAELIFECRVVGKKSFWNTDSSMILTSNLLAPLKWFKGTYRDTIELLTIGGTVGNRFGGVGHSFQVSSDHDYCFFLKKVDTSFFKVGRPIYFPTSVNYGVVVINTNGGDDTQEDGMHFYKDIAAELYKPIAAIVGADYKIFAKNRHEEIIEREKRKKQQLDSIIYQRTVIEYVHAVLYHLSDAICNQPDTSGTDSKMICKFSVQAQSWRTDKINGEKLVSSVVYLNYDTGILGANLVARGFFSATASTEFIEHGYKLLVTDSATGLIKILLFASSTDSAGLVSFHESFRDLAECEVTYQGTAAKLDKLGLTFNIQGMQHQTYFWDLLTNGSKPFQVVTPFSSFEKVRHFTFRPQK